MTDRELLELAAKSYADPNIEQGEPHFTRWIGRDECLGCDVFVLWDPLTDDGDALRLAVKLGIHIRLWVYACEAEDNEGRSTGLIHARDCGGDVGAATRRAIVLAAAEIGRGM